MDLRTGEIESLPAMSECRCAHASVFFDDSIFVAGGQAEKRKNKFILKTMEKYVKFILQP